MRQQEAIFFERLLFLWILF